VLAGAPRIEGSERIVVASADSDGSDGPTPAAGAIVDGHTYRRAEQAGYDVHDELKRHNAHPVLAALGDTLDTGILKTNVQDCASSMWARATSPRSPALPRVRAPMLAGRAEPYHNKSLRPCAFAVNSWPSIRDLRE